MSDLEADTAVEDLGDGRYRATLHADWEIWGPMGGYVAAVALRAAGAASPFDRPASLACHYLGVAAFAPVDIEVTTLRSARTALSQRVTMTQEGRPIVEALVWSVGEVEGLAHHLPDVPDVAGPEGVPTYEELQVTRTNTFAFWDNLETKPIDTNFDWSEGPQPPRWRNWQRFRNPSTFADPWVDACRSVILLDVLGWPSAQRHHAWREHTYVAPSLDLYVAFHEAAPDEEWLLSDGFSPITGDGLLAWNGRIFSPSRRLVATGEGQALFRRPPSSG